MISISKLTRNEKKNTMFLCQIEVSFMELYNSLINFQLWNLLSDVFININIIVSSVKNRSFKLPIPYPTLVFSFDLFISTSPFLCFQIYGAAYKWMAIFSFADALKLCIDKHSLCGRDPRKRISSFALWFNVRSSLCGSCI